MAAHRAASAVNRGAERFAFGFAGACQNIRARAHAATDEHRLAGLVEIGRKIRMTRTKRAGRAFAMDVEAPRPVMDNMLLDFARVVRNVIEQFEPRLRKEMGEYLSCEVGEDLAVRQRAVNTRPHRTKIALPHWRVNGRGSQFPIGQIQAVT